MRQRREDGRRQVEEGNEEVEVLPSPGLDAMACSGGTVGRKEGTEGD